MIGISGVCFLVLFIGYWGGLQAAHWGYKDIEHWDPRCSSGKKQSPIDLSPAEADKKNFPPFRFEGYDQLYNGRIQNNGHTAVVNIDTQKRPAISGGDLHGNYLLDSVHFHWESEHTINNKRYAGEIHLVHFNERNRDLSQALSTGGVAVLGVFLYLSPDDNEDFAPIFKAIQQIQDQKRGLNVPVPIQRLELDDLLPYDRAGFYRYEGSLTTPNCTEGVTWTVFTNGLPISQKQLKSFHQLMTEKREPLISNYRPTQERNGRVIYLKISDMDSGANLVTMASCLKVVTLLTVLIILL